MTTDNKKGLYIHVPFCAKKCPYCDFFSVNFSQQGADIYTDRVCQALTEKEGLYFDTLYFGGGTPSLLGAERIASIIKAANVLPDSEITVECNPSDTGAPGSRFDFELLAKAGVNRISLGLQSAVDSERKALGRQSGTENVVRAVSRAKKAGINNISLDLMLGIPGQTPESLKKSLDFCIGSGATHISAYMLKIEENTPFFEMQETLCLPDEDAVCELYDFASETLENAGFVQYEISNFAKSGYESRHNLKYWRCEEYLGIGAAAHSFLNGRRFFYEADIDAFVGGAKPVDDGEGGGFEEYAMLALRLKEGLSRKKTLERFGFGIPDKVIEKAEEFAKHGLVTDNGDSISLTQNGYLISNTIIAELIL